MTKSDKPEGVRELEERVFSWMVWAMVLVATPIVLLTQVVEWLAGRCDWTLIVILAGHVVVMAHLLLLRDIRVQNT